MTQLVFQPALDPFHAVFRFLRLQQIQISKSVGSLFIDHVRILDFYLLFPFRIRSIRLSSEHQHFKKLAEAYTFLAPYEEQPDAPLLFERMRPLQLAALETMAATGYLGERALLEGRFQPTDKKIPEEILDRIHRLNAGQADLMTFMKVLAEDYLLSGQNGLKARTELMEYRYDAV